MFVGWKSAFRHGRSGSQRECRLFLDKMHRARLGERTLNSESCRTGRVLYETFRNPVVSSGANHSHWPRRSFQASSHVFFFWLRSSKISRSIQFPLSNKLENLRNDRTFTYIAILFAFGVLSQSLSCFDLCVRAVHTRVKASVW